MSEETSLAHAFASHTDEQIAAYPQTARAHIKGLADLCEQKQSELSRLRERVSAYKRTLIKLHESFCTEENCVLDGGEEHQAAFLSTGSAEPDCNREFNPDNYPADIDDAKGF